MRTGAFLYKAIAVTTAFIITLLKHETLSVAITDVKALFSFLVAPGPSAGSEDCYHLHSMFRAAILSASLRLRHESC